MDKEKKSTFKEKIKSITKKISQVFVSVKLPNTPWYAKIVGYITIAYALSPIDLIPDFIPILGYLDDFIILPLLVMLYIKLIPKEVWQEAELEAQEIWKDGKPKKWYYAIPIFLVWIFLLYIIIRIIIK